MNPGERSLWENLKTDQYFRSDRQAAANIIAKGVCYEDCKFKNSHKDLNDRDIALYSGHVKKLRDK